MAVRRLQPQAAAAAAPVMPSIDAAAAKEFTRAIEGKTALLKDILNASVAGKLPGVSLAEALDAATANGNCGFGCF